jgi:hypothetical protein
LRNDGKEICNTVGPMRRPILGGGALTELARNALEPDWNR